MNLLSLPDEVLLLILTKFEDVYELIDLSRVCKQFQALIKSFVLVLGDAEEQSEYFKGISGRYLHMDQSSDRSEIESVVHRFQLFIFEYTGLSPDSTGSYPYLYTIASCKLRPLSPLIEVFMTRKGASRSFQQKSRYWLDYEPVEENRASNTEAMKFHAMLSQVSKTMFLNDAEDALKTFNHEDLSLSGDSSMVEKDLIRFGHEYEFRKAVEIPQFWFTKSNLHPCRFVSKSVKILRGITNTSMTSNRIPPLVDFFQGSYLPNLEQVFGVAIESGIPLSMFDRYPMLRSLSLESAYTGDDELFWKASKSVTRLNSLQELTIVGNSACLCDLYLPSLQSLSLSIYGSREREEENTLRFERLRAPSLKQLTLEFTSLPNALFNVLDELSPVLEGVEMCSLTTNSKSFIKSNELINRMVGLKQLSMSYNNIDVNDIPQSHDTLATESLYSISPEDPPFSLHLSSTIEDLTLGRFDTQSVLTVGSQFKQLKRLSITLKIRVERQDYTFDQTHFPSLQLLEIDYVNLYSHLQNCNIFVKIDLKDVELVFTKQPLPMSNVDFVQLPKHIGVHLME